jgi:adenylate kinase family enzyme
MKSLSLAAPHLIVMVGIPGSGKSFFAEKFAATFNAPYISTQLLSQLVQGEIDRLAHHELAELLKTKQSIVFDGEAGTRTERSELARRARDAGYETLLIWVQTDTPTAKNRVAGTKRTQRYTDERYEKALKHFSSPHPSEKYLVISGKHTYASQAKVVLKKLSQPRASTPSLIVAPKRSLQSTRRNITIT